MNKNLLIIGKPHSAKSTFLIQFYSKLATNKSRIKLSKPVSNLLAISEGRKKLSMGEETDPTPPESSSHIEFSLLVGEEHITLNCLDYGGEQINKIIKEREISKAWNKAINESNNWIWFIRIGNLSIHGDLSTQTTTPNNDETEDDIAYTISDQTGFIELAQMFLHSKSHNYHGKETQTKLTIVLTCWDELETKETPKAVLSKHLPLLDTFIKSNWDAKKIAILGLSPQGMSLSDPKNKEKFINEGSENFGYLINAEGKKVYDITELISYSL